MSYSCASRSSGDLIADRRYAYAQAAFEERDFAAAAELASQVLDLVPAFAAAHALLGRAYVAQGRGQDAIGALSRALAIEPDDPMGVRIDLALLGALPSEQAITGAYLRALFDDYAPRFERHLVRSLQYRGPDLIHAALRRAASLRVRPFRFHKALDLGCGTGLAARALQGVYDRIEGVDLSPRMLAQARRANLYDGLHESELLTFLQDYGDGPCDLVLAADVFVYMASLGPVFEAVRRILAPHGLFAFTVQAHEGEGAVLGEDGRYAHSEAYLRQSAQRAGLGIVSLDRVSTRQDRGADVPGLLLVLEHERAGAWPG